MKIEFKDGKRIITHKSGVVTEQNRRDLETLKSELFVRRAMLNEQINKIEEDISHV